jgi:hypothetical protein
VLAFFGCGGSGFLSVGDVCGYLSCGCHLCLPRSGAGARLWTQL